jgi:Pyridoxamine 5'-phosphate oxidase
MARWGEIARLRPDLASGGHDLLCQFGVGLAFLATVRPDGAPRLHPICVVLTDDGLYGLIIPSLKLRDLKRDGRYTLHSYPSPENEDAVSLSGTSVVHDAPAIRRDVIAAFQAQTGRQGPPLDDMHFHGQTVVEFLIDSCLLTRTTGHGDQNPQHTVWHAPAP